MTPIKLFTVNMPSTVDKPLLETLHSGYISQGPRVDQFEELLSTYFKRTALTLNSGTSAVTLALRLCDIGKTDEVITTPMTCSATNVPILSLGGVPVFADIDSESGLIDPESVLDHITPFTKAIIAVDWGGTPVDIESLAQIAKKHHIPLIIDSAHAFGAEHTKANQADFVAFSLQAIKHISTADGGVLLCKSQQDYERGKKLRWFGISRDNSALDSRIGEDIEEWGYKYHMNDLNATIGIEQMKQLPNVLATHRQIAAIYDREISSYFGKPPIGKGVYWLYTLRLPDKESRDDFKGHMAKLGIMVSQVHRRNDEYTAFKDFATEELPGTDAFSETMICIPIHNGLTGSDMHRIIDACNKFAERA